MKSCCENSVWKKKKKDKKKIDCSDIYTLVIWYPADKNIIEKLSHKSISFQWNILASNITVDFM